MQKQFVCYIITLHGSDAFHVKICFMTCETTCEPVSMDVVTAPIDQVKCIPMYLHLSDTEMEKENL